ncbi:MAG TPA: hypothetical protein VGE02_13940 [Gemmatimonadales bacterium]
MTVPTSTAGEGEGVPPGMRTNPDVAFLDVFRTLTVNGRVRLAADGRNAFLDIYNRNLGAFLLVKGQRSPERDLWNDEDVVEFREFILNGVTLQIADETRRQAGAGGELASPLGARPIQTAALTVMKDPNVVRECSAVLRRTGLGEGADTLFITPVCTAVEYLERQVGESQLE